MAANKISSIDTIIIIRCFLFSTTPNIPKTNNNTETTK